jgi:hypothetical protein
MNLFPIRETTRSQAAMNHILHLLQIWREPSTGHARSVGYICHILCVCTQCAPTYVRARMCAFAYFGTDHVQICWEHITTHHKWQGLRTFNVHAPRARVQPGCYSAIRVHV